MIYKSLAVALSAISLTNADFNFTQRVTNYPGDYFDFTGRGASKYLFGADGDFGVALRTYNLDTNAYEMTVFADGSTDGINQVKWTKYGRDSLGFFNTPDTDGNYEIAVFGFSTVDGISDNLFVFDQGDNYPDNSGFGAAFDVSEDSSTVVVGCILCNNEVKAFDGSILVYDIFNSTGDVPTWTYSANLTVPNTLLAPEFLLGGSVDISGRTIVGSSTDSLTLNTIKVFDKDSRTGQWSFQQTIYAIPAANGVDAFRVDGDTLVFADNELNSEDGAVYVLQRAADTKPKPGPASVGKWSTQQVLLPPVSGSGEFFGSYLSLEDNTLIISELSGAPDSDSWVHVYKRPSADGKWSVQQTFVPVSNSERLGSITALEGSTFAANAVHDTTDVLTAFYSEDHDWNCLLVSLEDKFGDGWDTSYLQIEGPNGVSDRFAPTVQCNADFNPLTFRYCPSSLWDDGLYKFSIANHRESEFAWEIQWRVFEEKSGEWIRGTGATKMDFHFDAKAKEFSRRAIVADIPTEDHCHVCGPKPKGKPEPKLAPGATSAPTANEWEYVKMTSLNAMPWFSSDYQGTAFYISDVDGKNLISTGTLCDPLALQGSQCWQNIPDGEYVFRVAGALNTNAGNDAWEFCNVAGTGSSIHHVISVVDGTCTSTQSFNAGTYCAGILEVQILDSIEMVLGNVAGVSQLSATDNLVVSSAIASLVEGLSVSDIVVTSVKNIDSSTILNVQITMSTASFGVKSVSASAQQEMVASAMGTITAAASNGQLYSALMTYIAANPTTALHTLTDIVVTDLNTLSYNVINPVQEAPVLTNNVFGKFSASATHSSASSSSSTYEPSDSVIGVMVGGISLMVVAAFVAVGLYKSSNSAATTAPAVPNKTERDIEAVPVVKKEAVVVTPNKTVASSGRSSSALDKSMMSGLLKMVKDEDDALAQTMSSAHFK